MIARNRYKKDQWDEAEEAEDKKDPAGSPHIISRPEEPSSLAPRQAMTPTRLQDGNIRQDNAPQANAHTGFAFSGEEGHVPQITENLQENMIFD